MRVRLHFLVLVFVTGLLAACSPVVSADENETEEARAFLDAIIESDERQIRAMAHPDLVEITISQIPSMAGWFGTAIPEFEHVLTMEHSYEMPGEGSVPVKTIAFEARVQGMRVSMRADTPDMPPFATWIFAEVTFQELQTGRSVVNWQINPANAQPSTANSFGVERKSIAHYIILACAIIFPLICLTAVFLIWKGPRFRYRWLWTIGSLLGFGQISINWSTGDMVFLPIHVQLLAAGFIKAAPLAPTVIMIGIPIVAIVFLVWKREQVQDQEEDIVDVFTG